MTKIKTLLSPEVCSKFQFKKQFKVYPIFSHFIYTITSEMVQFYYFFLGDNTKNLQHIFFSKSNLGRFNSSAKKYAIVYSL